MQTCQPLPTPRRSLLSAEIKRQQQLRREGAGASVDLPATPRSEGGAHADSPALLSGAASAPQDGSGSEAGAPGSASLSLDSTSPFAAALKQDASVMPAGPRSPPADDAE